MNFSDGIKIKFDVTECGSRGFSGLGDGGLGFLWCCQAAAAPCTSPKVTLDFRRHFQSFPVSPFNGLVFSPIPSRKIVIKLQLIFHCFTEHLHPCFNGNSFQWTCFHFKTNGLQGLFLAAMPPLPSFPDARNGGVKGNPADKPRATGELWES